MVLIQKRNGTRVPFDKQKIVDAINKAFIEIDGELYETDTAKDIADEIEKRCLNNPSKVYDNDGTEYTAEWVITVEYIQDMVEEYLMRSARPDVARAYIRYRYKKEVARNTSAEFFDAIGDKLQARNVQNQNANLDEHSFGGRVGEATSVMTRKYALDNLISAKHKYNHENNRIYIHK